MRLLLAFSLFSAVLAVKASTLYTLPGPCSGTQVATLGPYSNCGQFSPTLRFLSSALLPPAPVVEAPAPAGVGAPPPRSLPEGAETCFKSLQAVCKTAGSGWDWLVKSSNDPITIANSQAAQKISDSCNAVNEFEAWNYCRCNWFLSTTPKRVMMAETLRQNEKPVMVFARLSLDHTSPSTNTDTTAAQTAVRNAVSSAITEMERSMAMVKSDISNDKTRETMRLGTNSKESVIVHSVGSSTVDLTWYLQPSMTYGDAFAQLNIVIEQLKKPATSYGFTATVTVISIDGHQIEVKDRICGE